MRYGIIGGIMLMGGPGIVYKPSSVITIKELRKVVGTLDFETITYEELLPMIPETPTENPYEFVAVVANNPQGMNMRPAYDKYQDLYEDFQIGDRVFETAFPVEWKEFVRCD